MPARCKIIPFKIVIIMYLLLSSVEIYILVYTAGLLSIGISVVDLLRECNN